jgi:hypothetical protein
MRAIEEKIVIPDSAKEISAGDHEYIGALAFGRQKFEYNTNSRSTSLE